MSTAAGHEIPGDQTVADLGELALIAAVTARLPAVLPPALGAGDDAAVLRLDPSGTVALTTDVLVEGVDFRRDWSTARDVGHRAAAANLSDIEAMGAVPTALLLALMLPAETKAAWVLELVDGFVSEASVVGAAIIGGDVSSGSQTAVAVTAVGMAPNGRYLTRSGARPGDVVAVAGRIGWAAAGLTVLSRGFRSPRALAEAHRRPQPPYGAGARAAAAGASALIDVSDGLLADLNQVSMASGVAVNVERAAIPVDQQLRSAAAAFNADPMDWALTGGDDHALVATFPADAVLPPEFAVIGQVVARKPGGPTVSVDGQEWAGPTGFQHFR